MITLALFIIVGGYTMYRVFKAMVLADFEPMRIFGTICTLAVGAAFYGAFIGTSWIISYNTDDQRQVGVEKTILRALDTGSDTKGSFFLGSGYFESGPAYTYLAELEGGGFYMAAQETRNAIVYQQDVEEPYVIESNLLPESRLWSIIPVRAMKEFYVPVGSVQEPNYRVDVER